MTTFEVGQQLVDKCRAGDFMGAIDALYADDIVSIEPCAAGGPDFPQTMTGIDAIRRKSQWWADNHEVHESEIRGPFPHEDRFTVLMKMEVTPKVGPLAGQRMPLEEVCLYYVRDGKIAKEEFFYHMG